MRFTAKLISAFVLTALIPVALLGYLSYSSAKDALQKQALEDLTLITDAREGQLYSFFELNKGRVADFSSDGFIRDTTEALLTLDAHDPRFAKLQKSLNTHLKRNKMPLDKSIRLISVLGMNGKVIASTDEREIGSDESEHVPAVLGEDNVFIGDVHFGSHGGVSDYPYHMHAAARITGRDTGARLGVIINFYDTLELNKILSGKFQMDKGALTSLPGRRKTLDIYLVNRNKLLITPSRDGGELMQQKVET
ncbi:MAG: hypothetical protein M0R70_14745, partial [Nitrospirae bacterium]|nr:hypothetical protein [Nitrospirota bacterium]